MNNPSTFSWDLFRAAPIIGIIRGLPRTSVFKIAEAYLEAGLTTLEVTMNTEGALDMISDLRQQYPALNIGAGTVCNMTQLQEAIDAGAQFIVTPILEEAVLKMALKNGRVIFPGAFTPSEIYRAWSLGAPAIKVFPATQLGPQYIKDVLAPLNDIKLIPTGGVTAQNMRAFFDAGAFGLGMGSALLDKKLIQQNDFKGLRAHFTSIKEQLP
ncbi:MAG TPA: bifunctional 4-hydroxy-2-oxoglutarate aldolase/2-dehydro-3-deoxy-phosphogluconate aldolase [Saprospiraceae bacterium]|nr:bifunctional 4-hydroxy-2-oxoglutarate aldolase/2-dehydro-3-deoxy-phosphogluconate aldolase [Saprospiraceae bacterium]